MSPLRVFVVDPDPRRGPWLAQRVSARGHEVEVLPHGELAIDRFVQAPADAILIEYVLPGRDGVATIEAIRWAPGGRDVRVVLLAREEPASAPLQMLALRVDATSALVGELDEPVVERALAELDRSFADDGTLALEDDSYAREMPEARRPSSMPRLEGARPPPDWLDVVTVVAGAHGAPASPIETAPNASFLEETTFGGDPTAPTAQSVVGAPPPRPFATFDELTMTEPGPGASTDETVSLRAALTSGDARALLGLATGTQAPKVTPSGFSQATRPAPHKAPSRFASRPPSATFRAPSVGPVAARRDPASVPPAVEERGEASAPRVAAMPLVAHVGRADEPATSELLRDPQTMDEGRFVRAQAEQGRLGDWSGSFSSTPFPALLRRIAEERASGGLVCTALEGREVDRRLARPTVDGGPPTKVVYFRGGVPVLVRSNLVDECFGQLLLRKKRIGVATLEESIRRMHEGGGLQGQILVEMGALAPIELGELLAEQARQKVFDLFGWRRGEHRFCAQLEVPRDGVPLEMALPDMVYEGVCAAMPATLLLDIMTPRLERYVVPDPVRLSRFARVRVAKDLRVVLERLDGAMRLREVLRMGQRPGAIAQLLYALECLGAIELTLERAPRPQAVSLPPLSSVEQRLEPAGSIPARPPLPFDRLRASEPQSWDDQTTEQPERGADRPLPVVPTTREPVAFAAAKRMTSGAIASVSLSGLVEAESDEHGREVEDPRTKPREAPGGAAMTGPNAPVAVPDVLDAHVDRMFEAERCFRRGNRSLARGEHREAFGAFERAVELCPEEGEFVAYLGWARHCVDPHGESATQAALTDLARATELAPDLHVTHLLRARVLEHAGRLEEARHAYGAVLGLEPDMPEAVEALTRVGRRLA
jgi:CheY-like chemotaxis protein/tetratricopeptide (TPR) repeat protein